MSSNNIVKNPEFLGKLKIQGGKLKLTMAGAAQSPGGESLILRWNYFQLPMP